MGVGEAKTEIRMLFFHQQSIACTLIQETKLIHPGLLKYE